MPFKSTGPRDGFDIWSWERSGGGGGGLRPIFTGVARVTTLTKPAAKNDTELSVTDPAGFDLYGSAYRNDSATPGDSIVLTGEIDATAKTITVEGLTKAIPRNTLIYTAPVIGYNDALSLPELEGKQRVEVRAIGAMSFTDGFAYVCGSTGSWLAPDDSWYETLGNFTSWYQELRIDVENTDPTEDDDFHVGVVHRNQARTYGAAYIVLNMHNQKLRLTNARTPARGLTAFIPAISHLLVLAA